MKLRILAFLAIIQAAILSGLAASPLDNELLKLQQQRDKALAAAAEPINQRYKEELRKLLQRAVASKDTETATKILSVLNPPSNVNPEYARVAKLLTDFYWGVNGRSDVFEFRPDGTIVNFGDGWPTKSWKLADDGKSVRVEYKKNGIQDWNISGDVMYHPTLGAFMQLPKTGKKK